MLGMIKSYDVKDEINKIILEKGIKEDDIICSMVYEFSRKLPYSMDYKDKDFVPGVFLNLSPSTSNKYIFKDYDNLYKEMLSWSDTFKSGILLQVCFIFQKMLMGEFPNDYQLKDEDYYNFGISEITTDKEYNHYLFEMLKSLPDFSMRVNSASDADDRREILEEIYALMQQRIGQKVGGFRRTTIEGDLITIRENKATISWQPYRDLEMLYYFQNIHGYSSFDCSLLIDSIKNKIDCDQKLSSDKAKRRLLDLHN